ncbi:hypothetical protein LTR78_004383 [Recurvomyces mirabilis]|uniref:Uncharacterized protein n=1 Tax=Recurvomyces mirabilis TaxID=574656 RepID=A0AAE0WQ31_9PEZI|nr:hypothetical protein LTR78_004383 [Recurvomyces mirabilis]KAK5155951.1 hypothetical protein LTS14_005517 [Recurvomyces mirabilis]
MPSLTFFLLPAALSTLALAKTDLSGCTSTDVSSPAGASIAWYVPGTGEMCAALDCGGGRAPPKTDVPGCPQYSGTGTYSPSYNTAWATGAAALGGYGTSATATASTTGSWSAWETDSASSSWDLYTTAPTSSAVTSAPVSSSASTTSTASTTPIVPVAPVVPSNGTMPSGTGSSPSHAGNSTAGITSSKPTATASSNTNGAMGSAEMFVGAAALVGFSVVATVL